MKKKIIITIAMLFIVGYYFSTRLYSRYGNRIISMNLGETTIYAEVVASKEKLAKGLGDREGLCSSCGMLFLFQKAGTHGFWMKDMHLPLDIVWIMSEKIVHIEKNVPPLSDKIFNPLVASDVVLEVSAGMMDELGMKIGDTVDYQLN